MIVLSRIMSNISFSGVKNTRKRFKDDQRKKSRISKKQ